jgi:hypothetical protein
MRYCLLPGVLLSMCLSLSAQQEQQATPDSIKKTDSNSSLAFSLSGNIDPHAPFSLTPVVSVYLNHFTAEARYNYEALQTFSAAVGYRFFDFDDFWYQVNPTVGFSVGEFDAFSPALTVAGGYGSFTLMASTQYSFAFEPSASNEFFIWGDFFYDFSYLFYGGINVQHTDFFSTPSKLDAGLIAGIAPGQFDFFFQANNFWNSSRYFIAGASWYINLGNKKHLPHARVGYK